MENEKKSEPEHIGQPDCPACLKIEQELAAESPENKELVDKLMEQWDGMVERMSKNLSHYLRRRGRETLVTGAQRLANFRKKQEP
jgi:hypothetical protein